jgi:Uma2 family endonuclease
MMMNGRPSILVRFDYERAAEEYLRNLPPEHFMEATEQATQRKITWVSLDLVHALWTAVQVFNELLVQYPLARGKKLGQVVPDNMLVLCDQRIRASGSYDVPFQPVGPFWVFEYVSKHNRRKDYDDNLRKYERELKVPYYLLFSPEAQELILYRRGARKYVTVLPDQRGRYAIPELNRRGEAARRGGTPGAAGGGGGSRPAEGRAGEVPRQAEQERLTPLVAGPIVTKL